MNNLLRYITFSVLIGLAFNNIQAAHSSPMNTETQNIMPIHQIESKYSFAQTISLLSNSFESKGMTIFAKIDHQQAAKQSQLDMQPATVIVFGTPKAGTPLMVKDPSIALQLPLKVLVTEVDGKVLVMFNDTKAIIANSKITFHDVENSLAKVGNLIRKIVTE